MLMWAWGSLPFRLRFFSSCLGLFFWPRRKSYRTHYQLALFCWLRSSLGLVLRACRPEFGVVLRRSWRWPRGRFVHNCLGQQLRLIVWLKRFRGLPVRFISLLCRLPPQCWFRRKRRFLLVGLAVTMKHKLVWTAIWAITYLGVEVLSLVHSDDLSSGFVLHLGVLNEFLLHHWLVFEFGWLVDSSVERVSGWSVTGFSISLTEYIFRLNSWHISSITYTKLQFNSQFPNVACVCWYWPYLEFASWPQTFLEGILLLLEF